MKSASLVICTHNRCESLRDTLQAVKEQSVPNGLEVEVVVVDNNSKDRTKQVVLETATAFPFPMRYLFEGRQGLSYARNRGIRESKGEIIAFTDDDVLPEKNWLKTLHETFVAHHADCVGGKILPRWESDPPAWLVEKKRYWAHLSLVDRGEGLRRIHVGEGGWIWGANFAFRRSIFDKVGLFRTDLGLRGNQLLRGEDGEIARRIAECGGLVLHQPKAVVYHRIPLGRTKLSYFRKLRFFEGISRQRMNEIMKTKGTGFPGWRFRSCLNACAKAIASYAAGRKGCAIDNEMVFWMELGRIAGALRGMKPFAKPTLVSCESLPKRGDQKRSLLR